MVNVLDKFTPEQLENFETNIIKDPETGCFIWASTSKGASPQFYNVDCRRIAHALFLEVDPGPRHGLVCRRNQYCMNPEHFEKPEVPQFMENEGKVTRFKPLSSLNGADYTRFIKKVMPDTVFETDCLWWWGAIPGGRFDGDKLRNEYGVFTRCNKRFAAHRVAFYFANRHESNFEDLDFDNREVRHTCGNRNCVNPEHLILADLKPVEVPKPAKVRKKREKPFDERHHCAKVDNDDRKQIQESEDDVKELAKKFGISVSLVYRIRSEAHELYRM